MKKAFCKMCVTICGRFCPDEGVVAGYDNRIRAKYTAKWGVQIAGMLFQTRSSKDKNIINGRIKSINIPHRYTLSGVDIIRSFYALLERKIIPKMCPSNSPPFTFRRCVTPSRPPTTPTRSRRPVFSSPVHSERKGMPAGGFAKMGV